MSVQTRHDAWSAGQSYDLYMGRWSRRLGGPFLDWLAPERGLDWLDVGCGTGALTGAIVARYAPGSVLAIDPSSEFVQAARRNLGDRRVRFEVGDAQAIALPDAGVDVAASALVLNFVPDVARALSEMRRVVRRGGTVAFYVWDYAGGGLEFVHAFWQAAAALDPEAADLAEHRRFGFCTRDGLCSLAAKAGLDGIDCSAIEVPTVFESFDDFWHPFTLGAGPAPGYCTHLPAGSRARLEARLQSVLQCDAGGAIALGARAWAVRGTVP